MGSFTPPFVNFAVEPKWDVCHAMLDRGESGVNERDPVRSALNARCTQRRDRYSPRHPITAPLPQNAAIALHWAAAFGQLAYIDKLLAMGAEVNLKNNTVPLPLSAPSPRRSCIPSYRLASTATPLYLPTITHLHSCACQGTFAPTCRLPPRCAGFPTSDWCWRAGNDSAARRSAPQSFGCG